MITCKNCQFPVENAYCPHCGQKAKVGRFTFKTLLHEVFHALTHADRNIFGLLKATLIKPGQTVREYLDGRRKSYFNPFVYFLIMLGLQAFVFFLLYPHPGDQASLAEREAYQAQAAIHKSIRILFAVLLPVVSLLTLVCYRRHNYTEYFVVNIFIAGTLSFLSTIGMFISFWASPGPQTLLYLQFLVPILYTSFLFATLYPDMPLWKVILFQVVINAVYFWIIIQVQQLMVKLMLHP